jgi:predicted transcriptional regulator
MEQYEIMDKILNHLSPTHNQNITHNRVTINKQLNIVKDEMEIEELLKKMYKDGYVDKRKTEFWINKKGYKFIKEEGGYTALDKQEQEEAIRMEKERKDERKLSKLQIKNAKFQLVFNILGAFAIVYTIIDVIIWIMF